MTRRDELERRLAADPEDDGAAEGLIDHELRLAGVAALAAPLRSVEGWAATAPALQRALARRLPGALGSRWTGLGLQRFEAQLARVDPESSDDGLAIWQDEPVGAALIVLEHASGLLFHVLPGDSILPPFLLAREPLRRSLVGGGDAPGSGAEPAVGRSRRDWESWLRERDLRFPTLAEWRHAAFAGEPSRPPWGDVFRADRIWHRGRSLRPARGGRPAARRPRELDGAAVEANAWGLVDMIGNVREWLSSGEVIGGDYETDAVDIERGAALEPAAPVPELFPRVGLRPAASLPEVSRRDEVSGRFSGRS